MNKVNLKPLDGNEKDFLLKEIEVISNNINKFDNISLIIKGWAITLWSTLLFFTLEHPDAPTKTNILLISLFLLIFFWFIDANFKYFQRLSIARNTLISDYLNNIMKEGHENFTFYIYDPIGSLSKRLVEGGKKKDNYYRKNYAILWLFLRSVFVRIIAVLYCVLIGVTFILMIVINNELLFFWLPTIFFVLATISFICSQIEKI